MMSYQTMLGNGTRSSPRGSTTSNASRPDRVIGIRDGIAIIITLQLGAGIFATPSAVFNAADSYLGGFALWLFAGSIAWSGAISAAELGTRVPSNSGLLGYLALCCGSDVSYIASLLWIFVIKPCTSGAMCKVLAIHVVELLNPSSLDNRSIEMVIAVAAIMTMIAANWSGLQRSRITARVFASLKIFGVLSIIVLGFALALTGRAGRTTPRVQSTGNKSPWQIVATLGHGLFEALWTYSGWESMGYVAGDLENPTKQLPTIINSGMTIMIAIYISVVGAYVAVLPEDLVRNSRTLSMDLGRLAFGSFGATYFSIIVCIVCLGTISSQVLVSSRSVCAAADSGYIPKWRRSVTIDDESDESSIQDGEVIPLVAPPQKPRSLFLADHQIAMLFNGALILSYVLLGSLQTLVNFSSIVEYLTLFTMMAGLLRIRIHETRSSALDGSPLVAPYRTGLHNPIIFCIACLFALGLSLVEDPVVFAAALCLPLLGIILVHIHGSCNVSQI